MPISVRCPCGRQFKVADQHAGKQGKCPGCGSLTLISTSPAAPAPSLDGFEGVADLLNEALAMPPVTSTASSWPAATPPEQPQPKKKKKRSSGAGFLASLGEKAVSLAVIGVLLALTAGLIWGGRLAYSRFRFSQALAEGGSSTAMDEITADLAYTVTYINAATIEADPTQRRRMQVIAGLVPSLPEGTNLAPLLEINPQAIPYTAAFELVRSRAKHEWLIEHASLASEAARKFAAEALRPTFPFGRLEDAEFAKLVERTTPEEKQQRYEKLYAELHKPYEAKLVGSYPLQFDAVWTQADQREAQVAITAEPRLIVTCKDYVWTIDFYGAKWTGKIDQLPAISLSCPTTRTGEDLLTLPRYQTLGKSQLWLACQDEKFVVSLDSLPVYMPVTSGAVPVRQDNSSRYGDSGVPGGASTTRETVYNNGMKISETIRWTLPERPGYSKFEITLVRASGR